MKPNLHRFSRYPVPLRLGTFLLLLLLLWLPLAAPVYWLLSADPNLVTILTMGLLFAGFIILIQVWAKYVEGKKHIFRHYGLIFNRSNLKDIVKGLTLGILFTFGLFFWEASLNWLEFNLSQDNLLPIILGGLLSALGISLAEELFFRGWLLTELEKDYSLAISLWLNAVIFAILHFLKPLAEMMRTFPQFPGLLLLGLILVWAKRSHRNCLGICIGLHAGLVWSYYIVNVGELVQYTQRVPPWITGVDGNPLAGILGIGFLVIMAVLVRL